MMLDFLFVVKPLRCTAGSNRFFRKLVIPSIINLDTMIHWTYYATMENSQEIDYS